jgi:hypothetical protein
MAAAIREGECKKARRRKGYGKKKEKNLNKEREKKNAVSKKKKINGSTRGNFGKSTK